MFKVVVKVMRDDKDFFENVYIDGPGVESRIIAHV